MSKVVDIAVTFDTRYSWKYRHVVKIALSNGTERETKLKPND